MFNPVNVVAVDIKKEPGVPHLGTYIGKSNIETKIGPQVIWNFTDENELPLSIYGFTNLNRAMNSLQLGAVCRITYRGTENVPTKYGKKDVHQVLVECDDGEPEAPLAA